MATEARPCIAAAAIKSTSAALSKLFGTRQQHHQNHLFVFNVLASNAALAKASPDTS